MNTFELNLDGLVGPSHHYAGLAIGNIASSINALKVSNPRAAALQGLAKMQALQKAGLKQGIIPPHARPNLKLLSALGFSGSPKQQIAKAFKMAPQMLSAAYSAASMWTANAATVSASKDTADGFVHFTAANLLTNLHRQQEGEFSAILLKKIFNNPNYFRHHSLLPASLLTMDEGAANHCRLCKEYGSLGLNIFVYGKNSSQKQTLKKYPARQTLEASLAIARAHLLKPENTIFVCQNPNAIDKGVFHNDVVAVANESVLLIHQQAFVDEPNTLQNIKNRAPYAKIIEISAKQCSLDLAVASYLFNSQLLTIKNNPGKKTMLLLAPQECEAQPKIKKIIDEILASDNPINRVEYFDLKQSMQNGGGPACLRLRVPLTELELNHMHKGVLLTDELFIKLAKWINAHYRDKLTHTDLADPQLMDECFTALNALTTILDLGKIYPFQQN